MQRRKEGEELANSKDAEENRRESPRFCNEINSPSLPTGSLHHSSYRELSYQNKPKTYSSRLHKTRIDQPPTRFLIENRGRQANFNQYPKILKVPNIYKMCLGYEMHVQLPQMKHS